jgi:hypothetical protein
MNVAKPRSRYNVQFVHIDDASTGNDGELRLNSWKNPRNIFRVFSNFVSFSYVFYGYGEEVFSVYKRNISM